MLIPTAMNLLPNQEKRILKAYKKRKGCIIKAKKIHPTTPCNGEMLLTPSQFLKYRDSKYGKVIKLPFQHVHLRENMKHEGGFLPMIADSLASNESAEGHGMYLNPWMGRKHK